MKLFNYISLCAAVASSLAANANVTFETADYKSLGVYDTWEESPFRTGQLTGNIQVLDNPFKTSYNSTDKVVGFQRSRYGSNTYGACIELKDAVPFTSTFKYVHVLIHKTFPGRVMLIGLGNSSRWTNQTEPIEQFWVYPMNDLLEDDWTDAVFPVKVNGNGEITVSKFVIVPDCEDPSGLTADRVVYIDDIMISDSDSKPRVGKAYYFMNFPSTQVSSRDNRRVNSVTFTSPSGGAQTRTTTTGMVWSSLLDQPVNARAGETITNEFNFIGEWMHGYAYFDYDKDGQFSFGVDANDCLDSSTELVSYTLYRSGSSGNGHNSLGQSISDANNGFHLDWTPPAFTLPSNLEKGFYRMRYKTDWNNIDPAGDANDMVNNGGQFIDLLVNIHEDNITMNQFNRNGEVQYLTASGTSRAAGDYKVIDNETLPFGQAVTIKMVPENGFAYNGIRVRHGYNLDGDSLKRGNPQYFDVIYTNDMFDENDCFTIPAEVMNGDVLIEGLFVEAGTENKFKRLKYNLKLNGETVATQEFKGKVGDAYPEMEVEAAVPSTYWEITGYPEGTQSEEDEVIDLTLVQNLPFLPSESADNANWYNMTIAADKYYVIYNSSYSRIPINSTATPAATNHNAQWAFIGNVLTGFKIVNRGAGAGKILSSTTNTSDGNTGGSVYPHMESEPVSSGMNTYWIPSRSSNIAGGFYLGQKDYDSNRMNYRSPNLAYWTGGADAGSTFTVTLVEAATVSVTVTYNVNLDGNRIYTDVHKVGQGNPYPSIACESSSSYYTLDGMPTGNVGTENETFELTLTQNLPFEVSSSFDNAVWYNMTLRNPVSYMVYSTERQGIYIGDLDQTNETDVPQPEGTDFNGQWAFIGDVFNGFRIVNRGAGDGMIFSSTTNTSDGKAGGTIRPYMYSEASLASDFNTTWIPTVSTMLTDGFYLAQKGHPANSINSRDGYVSYWTGRGTSEDNGSTFTVVTPRQVTGIDGIDADWLGDDVEYYNLQGVRVNAGNLTPGFYIVRKGSKTAKIFVK